MRIIYDILEGEMLCGDIITEVSEVTDGYHWSYEYSSDKYYKHIEARLDLSYEILYLRYDMTIGGEKITSEIERLEENVYFINKKTVHISKKITVFEMFFLLGYKNVFTNAILYNPIKDEFLAINIKGKGCKYTVLYPSLCYIVLENDRLLSCSMPREEMKVSVQR